MRVRATGLVLLASSLLSACSGSQSGVAIGTSLRADDLGGVFSFDHVLAGHRYGVVFPYIKNVTDQPVTVLMVGLAKLPAGLRVVGMRALPGFPRGPHIMLSREGTGARDDFIDRPNLLTPSKTTIPPHGVGHMYFAVDVLATKHDPGIAWGCIVRYRTYTHVTEQQKFHCGYDFGSVTHPYTG